MRAFFLGTVLAAVLFIAGCGGGGGGGGGGTTTTQSSGLATKPAEQVVAEAQKAAEAASAVHVSGQIHASGRQIGLDLTLVRGKGATGTLSIDGADVDLLLLGKTGYLRAGTDFWKKFAPQAGAVAQLFANKWLKFPANNAQFGAFTREASAKGLFKSLNTNHGKLENKGETTYKGRSVVAIDDTTRGGTLYVAATGTPYPVALVKTGKSAGSVEFGNWNQVPAMTAPKGALDLGHFIG